MRPSAARVLAPWRRRLRPIAAVLAGLVPLLVVTGCNPFSSLSSNSSGQVIRVAAIPGIDNANLYLAVHGGYFTRAGVTVKIEKFSNVQAEERALNQGSVDVIAADYGDMIDLVKVNVDENPDTASKYAILHVPTVSVFAGGEVVRQVIGARSKSALVREFADVLAPSPR